MSSQNTVLNNGQQAIVTTDVSRIFIRENRYETGSYTNSTYDPETILAGRLMGRIATSQALVKHVASASDGSQFPVGVLAHDIIIEDGDTVDLTICVAGDVVEDKVILQAGNTLNTVISSRSIRDRIASDTVGIKLVPNNEMTAYDNS